MLKFCKRLFNLYCDIQFSRNSLMHSETKRYNHDAGLSKRQMEIMGRNLPKKKPIDGVRQTLIVASGKGGVGKSTISANLAVSLKLLYPAKNIGLLDADVFGPSIPLMMNLHETPLLTEDKQMKPLVNYGVKCMSIGNLITDRSAVIWRGLMVMDALNKLLRNVAWGPLDYLIIDTPPGTGDTQLSLIQNLPIDGVLIVTTGQKAAVQVAKRGLIMFQKLQIPIIGIVNNMSNIICTNCSHSMSIFGDEIYKLQEEYNIDILQDIPMNMRITESCDTGKPIVISSPEALEAKSFRNLALQVSSFLDKHSSTPI